MQSVELNVGRTVFARTSSFGHCQPQRMWALAGMLSTKTATATLAITKVFIGFASWLCLDRNGRGPENPTLAPRCSAQAETGCVNAAHDVRPQITLWAALRKMRAAAEAVWQCRPRTCCGR